MTQIIQEIKDISLFRILFVCMGNICRSPAAEVIFHEMVEKAGLEGQVKIDSAGTAGYHQGAPPDRRMISSLVRRGYSVFGHARQIKPEDLANFDLILTMDEDNLHELKTMAGSNQYLNKIRLLSDFFCLHKEKEVPDPYYGGVAGFEYIVDLLEDGCQNLLKDVMKKVTPATQGL